jgi:hypothetical protein
MPNPPKEYEALFPLLRYSLFNKYPDISPYQGYSIEQYSKMLARTTADGIYSIIADALISLSEEINLPVSIKIVCGIHVEKSKKRYDKISGTAVKISAKLSRLGIKMMIMKGLSVSAMYPKPYLREFGDIDMYLFGKYETFDELMESEGIIVKNKRDKHSNLAYEGISIENHKYFGNIDIYKTDVMLQPILDELAKHSEQNPTYLQMDNRANIYNIIVPTADFNALFLLRHSTVHLIAGNMPLRHLCDWAIFLKNSSNELHKETIKSHFHNLGLEKAAGAFCYIAIEYLGLDAKCSIYENYGEYADFASSILSLLIEAKEFNRKPAPKNIVFLLFYKWKRLMRQKQPYKLIHGKGFWREKVMHSIYAHIKHPAFILAR